MKSTTRPLLSGTVAVLLALLVWFLLHMFQGGWAYVSYLILFPVVRVLAWKWTIEGWALLGCMVGYAVMFTLLVCFVRKTTIRGLLVAAHVVFVGIVLLKEWPYWV